MKNIPTITEWLKSKSEDTIALLILGSNVNTYQFMRDLSAYGVTALNTIPAEIQYHIFQMYVDVYRQQKRLS